MDFNFYECRMYNTITSNYDNTIGQCVELEKQIIYNIER